MAASSLAQPIVGIRQMLTHFERSKFLGLLNSFGDLVRRHAFFEVVTNFPRLVSVYVGITMVVGNNFSPFQGLNSVRGNAPSFFKYTNKCKLGPPIEVIRSINKQLDCFFAIFFNALTSDVFYSEILTGYYISLFSGKGKPANCLCVLAWIMRRA